MKVNVNQDKCIGCGNCVALTENKVFDFNDDGLATCIVKEVPEDTVDTVKDAISQCPTEAIAEETAEEAEEK